MKVIFVTPYQIPCGIAAYSEKLISELEKIGLTVEVVPFSQDHDLTRIPIDKLDGSVVHIQHEFSLLPRIEIIKYLLRKIRSCEKKAIVTMHTEREGAIREIAKNASLVIVHNDIANSSTYTNRIVRIPHYIPGIKYIKKNKYRHQFAIPEDAFAIGSTGFLTESRRFNEVIDYLAPFVREHKDIYIALAQKQPCCPLVGPSPGRLTG